MYSIAFPDIFSKDGTRVNLFEDHKATFSNLKLVLESSKKSLLGDPDFGAMLKSRLFEQNSPIIQDIVIEEVNKVDKVVGKAFSDYREERSRIRESKQKKLDQYVNLFKITQITNLFKNERSLRCHI